MARKTIIPKKDILANATVEIAKERLNHTIPPSVDLVKYAGGSINNLPVKTEEFKTWLQSHQERNPFIGKHAHYSAEDSADEVQLDDREELVGSKANKYIKIAEEGAKVFDPTSMFGAKVEKLGPSLKNDNDHDMKFIDITIVENMTLKLLDRSEDDIISEAKNAIKTYHNDETYETPINVARIVDESKILFIEKNSNSNKLLN